MKTTPSRLVLFDIDGTLITTGRAGVRGMNAAFQHLHGHAGALDGVTLAGRTDRAIVTEVFLALGLDPSAAALDALRDAYIDHLQIEIKRPVEGSGVLPGVSDSLDAFEADDDVGLGLLTGNFERGAAVKLGHFDLWRRFGFGAFGDLHADRRALVPIAISEAERAIGSRVPPGRVVVIGDTPLDVDCAHAHGAIAVGVATGPFSSADLRGAGADLVLEDLTDLKALTAAIRAL